MGTCASCGNDYDNTFRVEYRGASYEFDSFECAIEKLAPRCATCGCRVIGHGVQSDDTIYCGAHCAKRAGARGVSDRG